MHMKYFWMIKIGNIKTVMQELLMMLTYIYQRLFKTFKWKSSTAFLSKEMKHAMHSFIWYIYYHASMYMYMYYDNDNPYWKTSSLLLFELALYSVIIWNEMKVKRQEIEVFLIFFIKIQKCPHWMLLQQNFG